MALFVGRELRRRLAAIDELVDPGGRLGALDGDSARRLAEQLAAGAADGAVGEPLTAGRLLGLARLAASMRRLVRAYLDRRPPQALLGALRRLESRLGRDELRRLLTRFADELGLEPEPGAPAGRVAGLDPDEPRLAAVLPDLIVYLALEGNPSAAPWVARAHPPALREDPLWQRLAYALPEVFPGAPATGTRDLFELLEEPARASPQSLAEQLRSAHLAWAPALAEGGGELMRAADLLEEEVRPRFAPGPGPVEAPPLEEPAKERFSVDRDWMPRLVLQAKNVLVWLDQLARRYRRRIDRLDRIPDEVLDELAEDGVTGLWLIGLWERSAASARIKRLCGNPEASGSAYAVRSYRVAAELGGDEALAALDERAAERGVRLAADMVPNHFAIDSEWVVEHPERFLSLDRPPFAGYRFEGPDLSPDPRVGLWLENGYYDRTEAAVVFKRLDRASGEVRYLYHGNDGTSVPWNDTAQLDYLDPAVRQAVVAEILSVARRFPILRFDAAMALTRRHIRRLWHPPPGEGGAIPSRAERALPPGEFDRALPGEFWREVVERLAVEAPGTLLLAEAFWLMEGYFVRHLGMHRVYNSAFMHMLRDGRNAELRELLGEALERAPGVLERYVNFLSNPDEESAARQFGTGDRYFGAATLLATLPGLPMLAHGQLEGLAEKYGMEYRRAYATERPDPAVVERHRRQIVPLLRRRGAFARVEDLGLFEVEAGGDGGAAADVVAYCNGPAAERSVVVFNNSKTSAAGHLRRTRPRSPGSGGAGALRISQSLTQTVGLAARGRADRLVRFEDTAARRVYLRPLEELRREGLGFRLAPWESRVLERFTLLGREESERLRPLAERLGVDGAASLDEAERELAWEPAFRRFGEALAPLELERLAGAGGEGAPRLEDDRLLEALERAASALAGARPEALTREPFPAAEFGPELRRRLLAIVTLRWMASRGSGLAVLRRALESYPGIPAALVTWAAALELARAAGEPAAWIGRGEGEAVLEAALAACGAGEPGPRRLGELVALALRRGRGLAAESEPEEAEPGPAPAPGEAEAPAGAPGPAAAPAAEGAKGVPPAERQRSALAFRLALEAVAWSATPAAERGGPEIVRAWGRRAGRVLPS